MGEEMRREVGIVLLSLARELNSRTRASVRFNGDLQLLFTHTSFFFTTHTLPRNDSLFYRRYEVEEIAVGDSKFVRVKLRFYAFSVISLSAV